MQINLNNYNQKKTAGLIQLEKLSPTAFKITVKVFDPDLGSSDFVSDILTINAIQSRKIQLQNQLTDINQLIADLQAL